MEKSDSAKLYRPPTRFPVVKKGLSRPPARFAMVKTDTPNLYVLLHDLPRSKLTLRTYSGLLLGFRWSKRTLRTCTGILHALWRLNHSPKFYRPRTRFAVVKTDSANLYRTPTQFAVVKTDPASLYRPPTCFAMVKTTLRTTARLLHAFLW